MLRLPCSENTAHTHPYQASDPLYSHCDDDLFNDLDIQDNIDPSPSSPPSPVLYTPTQCSSNTLPHFSDTYDNELEDDLFAEDEPLELLEPAFQSFAPFQDSHGLPSASQCLTDKESQVDYVDDIFWDEQENAPPTETTPEYLTASNSLASPVSLPSLAQQRPETTAPSLPSAPVLGLLQLGNVVSTSDEPTAERPASPIPSVQMLPTSKGPTQMDIDDDDTLAQLMRQYEQMVQATTSNPSRATKRMSVRATPELPRISSSRSGDGAFRLIAPRPKRPNQDPSPAPRSPTLTAGQPSETPPRSDLDAHIPSITTVPNLSPPQPEPTRHDDMDIAEALLSLRGSQISHEKHSSQAQRQVPEGSMETSIEDSQEITDPKRLQASAFLESLMTSFLSQLRRSLRRVHEMDGAKPADKRKKSKQGFGIRFSFLNRATGKAQVISFPDDPTSQTRTPALQRMARVLCVAAALYEAVLTDVMVTKRDIYYRNVTLFEHQAVVDKIIDDLVNTAELKRYDFRVCAAAKGLVASSALTIRLNCGEDLTPSTSNATLIPPGERIAELEADGLDWVLIVEKDAVMQSLCGAHLLDDIRLGLGAIVTGKGYPDLSTQQLLRRMADTFPEARFYALVDADPHGIDIMSVYKHGSRANAHSSSHDGLGLGDRLQWLGVKASEWPKLGRYNDLLPLGERDTQMAIKMCTSRPDMDLEWRRELSHMLHLRRKAEIQILCGPSPADSLPWLLEGRGSGSSQGTNRLVEYIVDKMGCEI